MSQEALVPERDAATLAKTLARAEEFARALGMIGDGPAAGESAAVGREVDAGLGSLDASDQPDPLQHLRKLAEVAGA